jgi:putative redox protein
MSTIEATTEAAGEFRQTIRIRAHELHADVDEQTGGHDSAPGAHDYFDAALAACKAFTATLFARRHGIPLERVESSVDRDDSGEQAGAYKLRVRLAFHGSLTAEQRARLYAAVARCPIHKLMTTSEVVIEIAPVSNE